MEDNVFLDYEGTEVCLGTVSQVQAFFGSECEEAMESASGKMVLRLMGLAIASVVEELVFGADPIEESTITVRIG